MRFFSEDAAFSLKPWVIKKAVEPMTAEKARPGLIFNASQTMTLEVKDGQAVLDARRCVEWLVREGYDRIGIMGTSLGSCLSMLTMAHEPAIAAGAFNHVSPYFAHVLERCLAYLQVPASPDLPIPPPQIANVLYNYDAKMYTNRSASARE